jgi:flap endonuclease-1
MGIAFKDLIISKEIRIDDLQGKILAVDAHNMIYQFLTTIRGRDGSPLMDSKGQVTSHLVGLLSRTSKMLQKNLKLVFVFDGKAPDMKKKTVEKRKEIKLEAEKRYKEAVEKEDAEEMRKYGARTSRLTEDIILESKKLLEGLGIPVVQAPSEGEAQASNMVNKGNAYAVVSQDYDSLVHGATKLLRNFSIAGKRKKTGTLGYDIVKPEMIDLAENLNNLGIDRDQLIVLAMLVGTDYNPGGVKGIGPKNALKLVKQHKTEFNALFNEVKWNDYFDFDWEKVFKLIKEIPVTDDYNLEWNEVDEQEIKKLLVERHDFSQKRIENTLEKLNKQSDLKKQKGLGDFF